MSLFTRGTHAHNTRCLLSIQSHQSFFILIRAISEIRVQRNLRKIRGKFMDICVLNHYIRAIREIRVQRKFTKNLWLIYGHSC